MKKSRSFQHDINIAILHCQLLCWLHTSQRSYTFAALTLLLLLLVTGKHVHPPSDDEGNEQRPRKAFLSDQSMASTPRKGQAKRSGAKTTSHDGKAGHVMTHVCHVCKARLALEVTIVHATNKAASPN